MNHTNRQMAYQIKAFRAVMERFDISQIDFITLLYIGRNTLSNNELIKAGMRSKLDAIIKRGTVVRCEGRNRRYKASAKGLHILSEYYRILDEYYKHITPVIDKSIIDTI
jgi:hypothetical protein